MDGICALYERKLKDLNPANRNITYDIGDLYNFIDGLADMSALVYFSPSLPTHTRISKHFKTGQIAHL
uniref:Enhancer of rudimentary homolog n=1 Tax=Salix viminalis TaxID=40686 RepID=A0A6N2K3G4_SALVM